MLPSHSQTLIAFPRARWQKQPTKLWGKASLLPLLRFYDLPPWPLCFSLRFKAGFIIFLGDKRLHFLSCLISEARSLKRKKPKCLKSYEVVVSWWWSDTCNTYINTYTALIIVHIQWEENLHKKEWGNRSQNEQSLLFLTCFTYSNLLGNEW